MQVFSIRFVRLLAVLLTGVVLAGAAFGGTNASAIGPADMGTPPIANGGNIDFVPERYQGMSAELAHMVSELLGVPVVYDERTGVWRPTETQPIPTPGNIDPVPDAGAVASDDDDTCTGECEFEEGEVIEGSSSTPSGNDEDNCNGCNSDDDEIGDDPGNGSSAADPGEKPKPADPPAPWQPADPNQQLRSACLDRGSIACAGTGVVIGVTLGPVAGFVAGTGCLVAYKHACNYDWPLPKP